MLHIPGTELQNYRERFPVSPNKNIYSFFWQWMLYNSGTEKSYKERYQLSPK